MTHGFYLLCSSVWCHFISEKFVLFFSRMTGHLYVAIECHILLFLWFSFFLSAFSAQTGETPQTCNLIICKKILSFHRWRTLFQWCSLLWQWNNTAHLWYPVFLCCGFSFPKFCFSSYSNILATRGKFQFKNKVIFFKWESVWQFK